MRFFIVLAIIANLAIFAVGQGYFGSKPVDDGRSNRPFSQRMQQSIELGTPIINSSQEQ